MHERSEPISVNYAEETASPKIFPLPPILSSLRSNWKNIQLAHYIQPAWEVPELAGFQHTIVMSHWKKSTEVELTADGKENHMSCSEDRYGCIRPLAEFKLDYQF